jgi:hypothetical protein
LIEVVNKSGKVRSADQRVIRELVCEIVARVCRQQWDHRLRSLLLTGSVARDETTILAHPSGWRVLGDADFMAVFQRHAPLPAAGVVAALTAKCESDLRAAGVFAHVGLAVVHDDYFCRLPAHIFTYELRCCGRMVCGDGNPLGLIPRFPASAIDTEDAWRLLANRTIECLELSANSLHAPTSPSPKPGEAQGTAPNGSLAVAPEELHYRAVKLFLDMATSLLVFLGAYEPTYGQRAQSLQQLAERREGQAALPFGLKVFAGRVNECTRWKISGGGGDCNSGVEISRQALDYACQLWRWELAQLTSAAPEASPEILFAGVAARQSALEKLRGWLYVVRRTGWLRGVRSWPRWMAMGPRCTPRCYIYEAAWRLAASATGSLGEPEMRQIRALLPVAGGAVQNDGDAKQQLAREVAWNYRTFLTETRA